MNFNLTVKQEDAIPTIEEATANSEGLLQDFVEFIQNENSEVEHIVSEVSLSTETLIEYVQKSNEEVAGLMEGEQFKDFTISNFFTLSILENQNLDAKIIALEIQNKHFKSELAETAAKCKKLLSDRETELKDMANSQAGIGSVLSTLLWKISKSEEITSRIISSDDGNSLRDFLFLARESLSSFMEMYKCKMPPTESFEYKMGLGMIGILVNISGHQKGRNFIIDEQAGRQIIQLVLKNASNIDVSSGYYLKRLSIIFLYNMAISKRVIEFLQSNELGIVSVFDCIKDTQASDIQCFALKFIVTLLDESQSNEFKRKLADMIPVDMLQKSINETRDEDYFNFAQQFKEKVVALKSK